MTSFANMEVPLQEDLRPHAKRLQFWRLCCNASCRRARSCRGNLRLCGARFADWAEAVRETALRELNESDPARQASIADLKEKIVRLGRTMTDQT